MKGDVFLSKDEYVDSVKLFMEKQDMYFNWFMLVLGIVLVFVGILQWRLSSRQISQIKIEAKEEAKKEIIDELVKTYQIDEILSNQKIIYQHTGKLESIENQLNGFDSKSNYNFKFEVSKMQLEISKDDKKYFDLFYELLVKNYVLLIDSIECAQYLSEQVEVEVVFSKEIDSKLNSSVTRIIKDIQMKHNDEKLLSNVLQNMKSSEN